MKFARNSLKDLDCINTQTTSWKVTQHNPRLHSILVLLLCHCHTCIIQWDCRLTMWFFMQ